ncbi:transposase zinc-binding domain-containing protein, partial [bacterium]|nr:transposase zinc-binding domain-containing protein [bacterium]
PDCKIHMAVPFSCKTRVCPSCVNRRAEVLSHTLAVKLPDPDYRHLVETPFVSRRIAPAWREF